MIEFLTVEDFVKRDVYNLLGRAFKPLMNPELETKLRRYDENIFDNPQTVGASLFLTKVDSELVGMASWDPRQFPKAIVGYNCILPEYQGRGFGKLQLMELLKRLKAAGFTGVAATTGDHPFYVPSQKMYENCGFGKIQHHSTSSDPRYGSIEYFFELDNILVNPVNPV